MRTVLVASFAAFCLGVVVTVTGTRVVHYLFAPDRPDVVERDCSGASVSATLTFNGDGILGLVSIYDRPARTWEVSWYGGDDYVTVKTEPVEGDGHAVADLGDADDGLSHTALVRPHGASTWCRYDVTIH